jgi:glyoxylase-like metal-dependent hydrolase (beta-lactamase superfamily II)
MEIKHLALGIGNVYLVKTANGLFLIDSGIAMSRSKLDQLLEQEGVNPADIKLVIITHGDLDHIGNCAYLQRKYGLKIAIHADDADLCRTGKGIPNRKRKSSLIQKMIRPIVFGLIYKSAMKKFPLETFEPDIILADGQDFSDIGFDAKVVHIPGHSKGSVGILTGGGDFFSGDTINNSKKPTVAHIIQDEAALAQSLEKIRALNIRNVYPGHGKPFAMVDLKF